jgi:hypothetical protein
MGLKGYRLWAMGQLDSTCSAPLRLEHDAGDAVRDEDEHDHDSHRGVALQVAFERQTLKPVFHLIGYRLWV